MIKMTRCTVTSDESVLDELVDALIITSGDSPNATVTISAPDHGARRYRRADRLLGCTVKGRGKKWTITGRSELLTSELGVAPEESVITYNVITEGPCENCG